MNNDPIISHSKQAPSGVREFSHWSNQSAKEAKNIAKASEHMSTNEFSLAIKRLETNLLSEKPLRHDVPRGYYLNIQV